MKNLKFLITVLGILLSVVTGISQDIKKPIERKGFVIGFSVGSGVASISDSYRDIPFEDPQSIFSFPNLKVGWMLNERTAILASYQGAIYERDGKDRSFDAIIPSIQYWTSDRWWINLGLGLAIDSPALYESNIKNEDWNFGGAVSIGTGVELLQKQSFALEINTSLMLGRVNIDDGISIHRDGIVFSIGFGFTWY